MIFLGIDLACPILHAALAVVLVGFLTAVSLLKLYAYLSCGYFHDKTRMDGKTVIITGPTGGIGKETARELAQRGAKVILACRNVDSGKATKGECDTAKVPEGTY